MKLMRDKVAYLDASIDKYRPREPSARGSLAAELQHLEQQLADSRSPPPPLLLLLLLLLQFHLSSCSSYSSLPALLDSVRKCIRPVQTE